MASDDISHASIPFARKANGETFGFLKSAAKPRPDAAPQGAGLTLISLNVEIVGAVTSPDDLNIFGRIQGNVRAASVTICEGGSIVGDVTAETVTVNGKVDGCIRGRRVQLLAHAVVNGDIHHSGLGIDPEAMFEGASRRVADPLAEVTPPAPANAA